MRHGELSTEQSSFNALSLHDKVFDNSKTGTLSDACFYIFTIAVIFMHQRLNLFIKGFVVTLVHDDIAEFQDDSVGRHFVFEHFNGDGFQFSVDFPEGFCSLNLFSFQRFAGVYVLENVFNRALNLLFLRRAGCLCRIGRGPAALLDIINGQRIDIVH